MCCRKAAFLLAAALCVAMSACQKGPEALPEATAPSRAVAEGSTYYSKGPAPPAPQEQQSGTAAAEGTHSMPNASAASAPLASVESVLESAADAAAKSTPVPPAESKPEMPAQSATEANEDGSYLADTETAVIAAINVEREALGLGTLVENEQLTQAARIRSAELCQTGHWDHTRPNGESWATVLKVDVPFSFTAAGENLATITHNDPNKHYEADADWWFSEWKNSSTHYENMIRAEFNEVGVGIYFTEAEDGLKIAYATTLFAKTEQSSATQ